jgi:hypothetical protein
MLDLIRGQRNKDDSELKTNKYPEYASINLLSTHYGPNAQLFLVSTTTYLVDPNALTSREVVSKGWIRPSGSSTSRPHHPHRTSLKPTTFFST